MRSSRCERRQQAQDLFASFRVGSNMTFGFTFTTPGPVDGFGSPASRQAIVQRRGDGPVVRRSLSGLVVRLIRIGSVVCHRYYDQLSQPNVRPTRLCYPARCVVP